METDAIIGCLAVLCALGLLTFFVAWSRRSIDRIARNGFGSARELRGKEPDEG